MEEFDAETHPHRRLNPLTNEYVLVSPHRTKRPWLGQTEAPQILDLPQYDPACYLCPGNPRSGGQQNPVYEHTYTFVNDFSAVLPAPAPTSPAASHPLLTTRSVHGTCDVLIFHPRHDLTLARLVIPDIERVIEAWIRIYKQRGTQEGIKYVQIFENKGAIMGCSNPHPHGQVWSLSDVPTIAATEIASLRRYSLSDVTDSAAPKGPKGRPCLLCEYAHIEIAAPEAEARVVVKNDRWVAVVPWWATWPFEVLLLPYQRHVPSIADLTEDERVALAEILSKITIKYDNLFSCSFAYSMGIHQRPIPAPESDAADDEDEDNITHLHLHFYPPLLRSASVKKFLVGFELMAEAQRDLTPEQAARKLRACSEVHYLHSN
ncbi:putative galactose-1-phosphate uridylyltransferase [Lyophyllum shimeji]|uniref:Galactose-1-phosphate uridylyltransferase n=1 Tax=Lyophyllum shimeji TaxID=47721 RepID=A0A9P3PGT3_LYOSH|nr:putative galactose-1-phosphate uridylyltransferase [Lyophyllum shimeji]